MASEKVKIGFIGVGFMGQLAHLQNYVQLPDCEVVAIADAKIEQAKKVAAAYGVSRVYQDYHELLADKEIVGVVASQQYRNHVNIVPDILNAGKHVMTEKPLTLFAENARPLVDLAKAKNLIHMVGYHKRSDPASELCKEFITEATKSGIWGKLKYIRITMPPGDWVGGSKGAISTNEAYPNIEWEKTPDGIDQKTFDEYNTFVNYYIHQVNLMRFFLGEDYKVVFADKKGVLLVTESDSGITGTIEMEPYSTSGSWQEKITVFFDRAYIEVELPAPLASQQAGKLTIFTDLNDEGGKYTIPVLPNVHAMKNQANNFIRALKGEKEPPCSSREAILDLEVAMDYIKMWMGKKGK
jgi:predicted dehydrogenase